MTKAQRRFLEKLTRGDDSYLGGVMAARLIASGWIESYETIDHPGPWRTTHYRILPAGREAIK